MLRTIVMWHNCGKGKSAWWLLIRLDLFYHGGIRYLFLLEYTFSVYGYVFFSCNTPANIIIHGLPEWLTQIHNNTSGL